MLLCVVFLCVCVCVISEREMKGFLYFEKLEV